MKLKVLTALLVAICLAAYFWVGDGTTPHPQTPPPAENVEPRPSKPGSAPNLPLSVAPSIDSSAPTARASATSATAWLESRAIEVLFEEANSANGYQTVTQIVRTDFHKSLLRAETRSPSPAANSSPSADSVTLSVANEFIAMLAPSASFEELSLLAANIGAEALPIGQSPRHARIIFPADSDLLHLPALSKALEAADSIVRYVEPDFLLHTTATTPNDPSFSKQRNLHSSVDHDIDAPEAWAVAHDASSSVIAIIDTGLRSTHEDLAPNLWKNARETANGIDDDGNGIIDDLHGVNAIEGNGDIEDDNGHGSHVAGIAGAQGNNGLGIAGVAWNVQLMPLKFLDSTGFGTTSDAIECIEYATTKDVDVINNSWGGSAYSQALFDTLSAASDKGILIATSAGNESQFLDAQPTYPAAYSIPNQLVVVATDHYDRLAPYSNHSPLLAHIAAPGQALSSSHTSDFAYIELAGTSMAAPHVAGALALLKAKLPELPANQIAARLLDAVDISAELTGNCLAEGRLNLHRALLGQNNSPANDDFSQASLFPSDGGRVNGSTTRATSETGEALPDANSQGRTVWHKWIPSRQGRAQVRLAPIGFSASIAIYQGDSQATLERVAANSTPLSNNHLLLDFDFQYGSTFYFQIDSTSVASGPYSIELALAADNDAFTQATQLSGDSFSVPATNQAASSEPGESPFHPSARGASVWFEWTAPSDGDYYLRAAQADFRMFTAVFTGTSLSNLTAVEIATEDRNPGNVLFRAYEGVTYRFGVDSLAELGSRFRLEGSYLAEPRIVAQPRDLSLRLGSTARFSVSVFGLGAPSFQWLKNGVEIPGATSDTLILPKVGETDIGQYQARIRIASRTLVSRQATLTRSSSFVRFLRQPSSLSILEGDPLRLSVALAGATPNLSYQWLKNGDPIAGQTQTALQIENATPSDSGFYSFLVSNGDSSASSQPAYVLVSRDAVPEAFSWTQFSPNFYNGKVQVAGDFFVADQSDYISFSSDGFHWQFVPLKGSQATYFDGYYYAASYDGIYRSENMMQWDRVLGDGTTNYYGIVAGNGTILCHTPQKVLRSKNGTDWTDSLDIQLDSIAHIQFGADKFVIRTSHNLKVSDDGLAWASNPLPENGAYKLYFEGGKWWMSGGESKKTYVSSDAKNWQTIDQPFDALVSVFSDQVLGDTYLIGITDDPDRYSVSFIDIFRIDEMGIEFVKNLHHGYDTYFPQVIAIDGQILVYIEGGPLSPETYAGNGYSDGSYVWWKNATLSFANNKFITAHDNTLRSSGDGTTWKTEITSEVQFGQLVHGKGLYVGSNHYGNELSSLKAHNRQFVNVAFTGDTFVGVGENVYYSNDGATWTEAETKVSNIHYMTAGSGVFIGYYDDVVYRSSNGIQWQRVALGEGVRFARIAYGDDHFVAFSGNQSYTSTDGATWIPKGKLELANHFGGTIDDLVYTQGKFIATFSSDTYFQSVDATSWQLLPFTSSHFNFNQHISYAASPDALLVVTKLGIGIIGSPPGSELHTQIASPAKQVSVTSGTPVTVTFDTATSSPLNRTDVYISGQFWKSLGPDENAFTYQSNQPGVQSIRIVSYDEAGNSSEDSLSLTVAPLVSTAPPTGQFQTHDLLYHRGAFYAASDGGRIYVSSDGSQWKGIQTPVLERVTSLAASDDAIVATYEGDGILYTDNGVEWLKLGNFKTNTVTYNGKAFVTGDIQRPYLSTDGKTWADMATGELLTGSSFPDTENGFIFTLGDYASFVTDGQGKATRIPDMSKVIQIGENYLGLKFYGIYYSEDLQTWTEVTPSSDRSYYDLERIDGLVFAKTGTEITDVTGDGQNWIPISETFANDLLSYADGYYYALSYGQSAEPRYTLLRSPNGIEWSKYGPVIRSDTYSPHYSQLAAAPYGVVVASEFDGSELYFIKDDTVTLVSEFKRIGSGQNLKLVGPNGQFAITDNESFRIDENGIWIPTETRMQTQTAYANGVYIGSWHFGEFRSYDGITWTPFSLPAWIYELDSADVEKVATIEDHIWVEIRYRIINNDGYSEDRYTYIRTSDGMAWQKVALPEGYDRLTSLIGFKGSTYHFSLWEETKTLYRLSEDAESWQKSTLDIERSYTFAKTRNYLASLSDPFLGVSKISVTSDGQQWSTHDLPTSGYLQLVATDDAFYLLGDDVWQSANGKDWTLYLPYRLNASADGNRIIFYDEDYLVVETAFNDLAIEDAIVSSKEYAVGDTIEIQATLANRGATPLSWSAGNALSYAFTNSPGDWSFDSTNQGFAGATTIPFTALDTGETRSFTFEATVPNSISPDSYYLNLYFADAFISKDGNTSNDFFTRAEATPIIIPARTLTIPQPIHGSISGLGVRNSYAWKEKVLISAVADFGYQFDGWSGDLEYAEETLLVTLENDTSIEASFSPKSFNVDVLIEGNGTVLGLPGSQTIRFGEELDLTASPAEGWTFIGWEGYGQSSSNVLNAKVGRNLSIKARFGRLFSEWAKYKYGDDPQRNSPEADPDGTGISNLERFAFGLDYPEQRKAAKLGFRFEDNTLILRYAVYRGLFEYSATPIWSADAKLWQTERITQSQVGLSADLAVHEVRLPLDSSTSGVFLNIRVSDTAN